MWADLCAVAVGCPQLLVVQGGFLESCVGCSPCGQVGCRGLVEAGMSQTWLPEHLGYYSTWIGIWGFFRCSFFLIWHWEGLGCSWWHWTLLLLPCSPLYSNSDCRCFKPLFTLSNCVFLLVKNCSINYPTRKPWESCNSCDLGCFWSQFQFGIAEGSSWKVQTWGGAGFSVRQGCLTLFGLMQSRE